MIFKKLDDLLKNNVYIKCSLCDYDAERYDNLLGLWNSLITNLCQKKIQLQMN